MTAKKTGYVVFSIEIDEADGARVRVTANDKVVLDESCNDIGEVLRFARAAIDDAISEYDRNPF